MLCGSYPLATILDSWLGPLPLSLPYPSENMPDHACMLIQRAARSQVSVAVSFEGARAAGSAVQPERSVDEDSAASAADAADGEQQSSM